MTSGEGKRSKRARRKGRGALVEGQDTSTSYLNLLDIQPLEGEPAPLGAHEQEEPSLPAPLPATRSPDPAGSSGPPPSANPSVNEGSNPNTINSLPEAGTAPPSGRRSPSVVSNAPHRARAPSSILTALPPEAGFHPTEGTVSLWSTLQSELFPAGENEALHKAQRINNFLRVPAALEHLVLLGIRICLDAFLFLFTILPLRLLLRPRREDVLQAVLVTLCCGSLFFVDGSHLYHMVRGQAILKLYVIFNVLEICDKLCSSFGHDILDSLLYWGWVGEGGPPAGSASASSLSFVATFVVALVYTLVHAMVLFYQVVTLNVAINSHNNALLTLLLSNQFVEIKSSVFKRFEKENLFQLSCHDCVERFQLIVFLCIVAARNLSEAADSWAPLSGFPPLALLLSGPWSLPSWTTVAALPAHPALQAATWVLAPPLLVYGCEVVVDALKHAFIVKFNSLEVGVYHLYYASLLRDLAHSQGRGGSSWIGKRIGFVPLPLACLVLRTVVPWARLLQRAAFHGCVGVWVSSPWPALPPWVDALPWEGAFALCFYTSLWLALLLLKGAVGRALLALPAVVAAQQQGERASPTSARLQREGAEAVDRIHRFTMWRNRIV